MASTRELEDTLPLASPLTQKRGFEERKIAVYTTLPLQTFLLQQLEQDLRDADDILSTDVAHLAPQPHFSSVLDIYNHHIDLAQREDSPPHDPSYFIVADQDNWKEKGLLFINLVAVTEQRDSFVGVFRCDLETATQIEANLEVGNMDWVDL